MRKGDRVAACLSLAIIATWLAGCGGGTAPAGPSPSVAEGESSPEAAVEALFYGAKEATEARVAGQFTVADRAYEKMAAVFGTDDGSISRAYPASEVRDRMIVLSACLRPIGFAVTSHADPDAWRNKRTTVTVQLQRDAGPSTLPCTVVLGRGQRWFVERIDLTDFTC